MEGKKLDLFSCHTQSQMAIRTGSELSLLMYKLVLLHPTQHHNTAINVENALRPLLTDHKTCDTTFFFYTYLFMCFRLVHNFIIWFYYFLFNINHISFFLVMIIVLHAMIKIPLVNKVNNWIENVQNNTIQFKCLPHKFNK